MQLHRLRAVASACLEDYEAALGEPLLLLLCWLPAPTPPDDLVVLMLPAPVVLVCFVC
jgi:hypothetical protein